MRPIYSKASGLLLLLCLSATTAFAQVTGEVTDQDGFGLPGVNILVLGTSSGTTTDLDGRYELTVPGDATLRFSYTGFVSQEISVDNRSTINVELSTDANVMEEVVVVGYGSTKREAVTGAISTVGAEEVTAITTPNIGEAIQGRLAGVQVTAAGPPGAAPQIQVRGIGSISFGSGPLIVVDGVPSAGGLNQFDSRDIAGISVLKDASATAIYGSRASNGVLIVTTKTGGKNQPIRLGFESTVGVQTQRKRYDVMSTEEYIRYAEIIAGMPLARDLDEIAPGTSTPYRNIDADYQDEIFQDGLLTQNSVNVSGGSERSNFYTSFGYLQQEGLVVGGGYERFNFRLNSDHDLTENGKFRFGQTMLIVNDERQVESNAPLRNAVQAIPYLPIRNPNLIGGLSGPDQTLDSADPRNPLVDALLVENTDRVTRILGTAFLEYDILEGLTARALYSANYNLFRGYFRNPIHESSPANPNNSISENRSNGFSPLYSGQLTYDRLIGDHAINATVVGELQEGFGSSIFASSNHSTNTFTVVEGGNDINGGSTRSKTVLQSLVGRLDYGYLGKYQITLSVRRDGSSIFAPGNQTELFPAAAVAWRISEEAFMENTNVSTLKLRASYGRTGSIGLGPYSFQAPIRVQPGAVVGGNVPVNGSFITDLANTDLSWELTDMLNVGLDVGFLNNRLNFNVEYYDRKVDNLILDVPLAPSFGPDGTRQNVGAMSNKGIELQAEYYSPRSKAFQYTIRANLSRNTNEVLRLAVEDGEIFLGQGAVGQAYTGDLPPTITRAGDPVFSFYGFQTSGIFHTQSELDAHATQENAQVGDVKFVDLNGRDEEGNLTGSPDGMIDNDDRVILGNYLPDFIYGINFDASYQNFDFRVFFQGSQGNDVYNGFQSLLFQTTRLFNGSPERLDGFSADNTTSNIPAIRLEDNNRNRRMSDRFLEDGSYLRLRNVSVGYTFDNFAGDILSNLRLYVSAQNLLTITGYSGLDPEIGSVTQGLIGFDNGRYPQPKTFLFGAQVAF